jgi:hypothetical protein
MIRCLIAQKPEACNVFEPRAGPHSKLNRKMIRPETSGLIGRAGPIGALSKLGIWSFYDFFKEGIRDGLIEGGRSPTVLLTLGHGMVSGVPQSRPYHPASRNGWSRTLSSPLFWYILKLAQKACVTFYWDDFRIFRDLVNATDAHRFSNFLSSQERFSPGQIEIANIFYKGVYLSSCFLSQIPLFDAHRFGSTCWRACGTLQ